MSLVLYYIFGVLFLILLLASSLDDWRTSYVPEVACQLGWILSYFMWFSSRRVLWVGLAIVALRIAYGLREKIPFVGDADLVPVAGFLAFYCQNTSYWDTIGEELLSFIRPLLPLFSLLCIMLPLAHLYYRERGQKYKLFHGMIVPMLPAFALAWGCAIIEECIINVLLLNGVFG